MEKLSSEIKELLKKMKELKITHYKNDNGNEEIIVNNQKITLKQEGGFNNMDDSSSDLFSETSNIKQNGGYSITSEMNFPLKSNLSETSNIKQNGGYSITSEMNFPLKSNLSETSVFKKTSDIYSMTSDLKDINFKGGYSKDYDTLQSLTELEDSQLDLDIFHKSNSLQKGGSINMKQKLNAIGINSSSTSSVCE